MRVLVSEKLSNHKYKTPEGYLICTDAILARTGKQTYTKNELFNDGDLTAIEVDRPRDQVFNPKTIASFENKPITFDHPDEDVNVGNYKDYAIGYVRDVRQGKTDKGEDVILGNLVITDQDAINAIEQGDHTDLSCGYDCDIKDDGNGNYSQTNIRGNHLALCEQGRAGIAHIVDSKVKDANMKDWTQNEVKRFKIEKRGRGYGIYYKGQLVSKYNDYDKEEAEYELDRLKKYYYVDSKTRDVDSKIRDEDRQLEVYKLCKANNWYTLGDTEDYEYMLNNADIWPVEKIAMNIANHSKQGFNEILTKLKTKLKDSNIRDTWSGTRNGIIYSYKNGFYYITHRNGKVERFPSDTFSSINELYKYVDKINDSVDDMDQRVFKFSTNIPALKRAISNRDKEEVESMLTTLKKDKEDFERWDEQGQMSNFDKKTFEKTMSEVMPGIKKMGLTIDSKVRDDVNDYKKYHGFIIFDTGAYYEVRTISNNNVIIEKSDGAFNSINEAKLAIDGKYGNIYEDRNGQKGKLLKSFHDSKVRDDVNDYKKYHGFIIFDTGAYYEVRTISNNNVIIEKSDGAFNSINEAKLAIDGKYGNIYEDRNGQKGKLLKSFHDSKVRDTKNKMLDPLKIISIIKKISK